MHRAHQELTLRAAKGVEANLLIHPNIRRIGFVASEITKNGGIAIRAPIAPYNRVCKDVSAMIGQGGGFVLVHVPTPLDICEQ
jgi:sulfate adenylyltransferase